jgi:hypothetical protein
LNLKTIIDGNPGSFAARMAKRNIEVSADITVGHHRASQKNLSRDLKVGESAVRGMNEIERRKRDSKERTVKTIRSSGRGFSKDLASSQPPVASEGHQASASQMALQEQADQGDASDRALPSPTGLHTKITEFTRQEKELAEWEEGHADIDHSQFVGRTKVFSGTDFTELFGFTPPGVSSFQIDNMQSADINQSIKTQFSAKCAHTDNRGLRPVSENLPSNKITTPAEDALSTVSPSVGQASKCAVLIQVHSTSVGRDDQKMMVHHNEGDCPAYLFSKAVARGGNPRNVGALNYARLTLAQRRDVNIRSKAAALKIVASSVKQK